jgi:hypothetical protein
MIRRRISWSCGRSRTTIAEQPDFISTAPIDGAREGHSRLPHKLESFAAGV